MWCSWAQQSDKFDSEASRKKWSSFGVPRGDRPTLTLAWVFSAAKATGWANPQARVAEPVPDDWTAEIPPEGDAAPSEPMPPVLTLEQLQAQAAATSWLVKGVVPADSLGVIFGGSGTFKSFVALDLALHIAHGLPWLGRKTAEAPVLFLAAEGGSGMWRRIEAWHKSRRLRWQNAPLWVIPVAVDLGADCVLVQQACKAAGVTPALVVVDTLSQTFSGEENSANEVAGWFREVGLMMRAAWQCAVAIIHHTGHQATERPRGSSAIRANVDWLYGVFRDEKEMLATMTCSKQKDGEPFADASFSLSQVTLGNDEDGDPITSLIARHLSSAEDVQEAMAAEHKAGRGGHNRLILSLAQNGMRESELRKVFYDECPLDDTDARRVAYFRARKWALTKGFFDIAQGTIVLTKQADVSAH
jgi:hypothetical protein